MVPAPLTLVTGVVTGAWLTPVAGRWLRL